MKTVVYYDTVTVPGEICQVRMFEDSAPTTDYDAELGADDAWLVDPTGLADPDTHYVNLSGAPTLTLRPTLSDLTSEIIIPDGTDTVTITGVPSGTVVLFGFDGSETTYATTQDFIFKTTINGEWSFTFTPPFPYVTLTLEISSYGDS